jgi:sterol desaturase/sphingolipid hydroxylase (fatty acid hydroxylase superfamily)
LTTVTHHDLHHERAGGNYGFYFTFWDRTCGT